MRRPDLMPVLALLGLVGLFLAGWALFPWFDRMMHRQDCIAVGRADCG